MEQFDTLDVSAVLNLESALVRDGASRQVLPAAVPLIRDW